MCNVLGLENCPNANDGYCGQTALLLAVSYLYITINIIKNSQISEHYITTYE